MDFHLDEKTLPNAVRWLFESNGYEVDGPIQHSGAEVDLVAERLGGFGSQRVYIEVTVEYVDTTKYGKDLTKLVMFKNEPGATCLIVSLTGFTVPVKERAKDAGIELRTYGELLDEFEQTQPYVRHVLESGTLATELSDLDQIYQEPELHDSIGRHSATQFLTRWWRERTPDVNWIMLIGEYGTGKTALTKILQRRWTAEHVGDPSLPIPFRVELRDFIRQFDSRSLLHLFLDKSQLRHLQVEFVEHLMSSGRVVLLLDGYDEMAQYLTLRERRACLEAFADLARGGARGIITSRPNFFTEAEEYRVFEVLYSTLTPRKPIQDIDQPVIEVERRLDSFLNRFLLQRTERTLEDLTPEQTRALVAASLKDDRSGAEVILNILSRTFRTLDDGQHRALSGKPVIVSYLLEIVQELKTDDEESNATNEGILSEWQVFQQIIAKLMRRDWARTPELLPSERQSFLEVLALYITVNQLRGVSEEKFRELVSSHFAKRIRMKSAEGVVDPGGVLSDDLRSSTTLTRAGDGESTNWQFSHNSIREFLLLNRILATYDDGEAILEKVPVSETLLLFARSLPEARLADLSQRLSLAWGTQRRSSWLGFLLSVLWQGLVVLESGNLRRALARIAGPALDVTGARINSISFTQGALHEIHADNVELSECSFESSSLTGAKFSGAIFDGVTFAKADLTNSTFIGCLLIDCDITEAICQGADFTDLDPDSTAIVRIGTSMHALDTDSLVGLLRSRGAITDNVDPFYVYYWKEEFDISLKIARALMDEGWRQRRGVEQRGAAQRNTDFAKRFVRYLIRNDLVITKQGGSLIGATPAGRTAFLNLCSRSKLDPIIESFWTEA